MRGPSGYLAAQVARHEWGGLLVEEVEEVGTVAAGDLGAEGAHVISAEASPNGRPLLMVSNEVSGSLRLFEISQGN